MGGDHRAGPPLRAGALGLRHERLGIPLPQQGEDVLDAGGTGSDPFRMSACPNCGARRFSVDPAVDDGFERGIEALISAAEGGELALAGRDLARPIVDAAQRDPTMLLGRLAEAWPDMDQDRLQERLAKVLFAAQLWGRLSVDGDA